ncbi:MAG: GNAT family N-acetyltransferase [Thermoanaerobaculia bacterium]
MISTRRATPDDAAALAAFASEAFIDTFAADNSPADMAMYLPSAFGENLQLAEITDPELITVLARDDGVMAAYAQMHITDGAVQIKRFYVHRNFHGRGLAQLLMKEAETIARDHNAGRLWLGVWERNHRAIAFYTKCGFHDVGSQQFILGTDLQFDRVMEKVVGSR